MVKLCSLFLSLLAASAAAGDSEVEPESRSLRIVQRDEVPVIGAEPPAGSIKSVKELQSLGYDVTIVEGDATIGTFDKLLRSGDVIITKGDVVIDPDTPVGDLAGPSESESRKIEKEIEDANRRLQIQPSQCLSTVNPSFGFANNACILARIRWGVVSFTARLCCNERCCARAWSCNSSPTGGQCKIGCNPNSIFVNTFVNPGLSVCCSIQGRIVSPFPTGRCFDASLCAA